jgi:hypothetical protein
MNPQSRKVFKSVVLAILAGIVTVIIAIVFAPAQAQISDSDCARWDSLSNSQRGTLYRAYLYGSVYGNSLTLPAIALAESNAGKWRLNYLSNDFGVMQINIVTASNILGVTNQFKRMELAERLVTDEELNFYLANDVLNHFRGDRVLTNQVWQEMVMSYNEGYRWRTNEQSFQKARDYYHSVAANVNMLRECAPWY